jgi:uncharacterized membrane protein YeaQ/YmgE (transglycosylase-associated protein family)
MAWLRHPLYSILVVLLLGVAGGLVARSLMPRRPGEGGLYAGLTAACVGLAGAFFGFHLTMLSNLATDQPAVPFLGARLFSALLLWMWARLRVSD